MSEHPDHVIRSYKWKRWTMEITHTRNGIPVRRKRTVRLGQNILETGMGRTTRQGNLSLHRERKCF